MALLGQKPHTAGNTTRYAIDYNAWLDPGVTLTAGSVTMDPTTPTPNISITGVTHTSSNHLLFFVAGGTVNEIFTLDVQITDSRGEVKNDTVRFVVVAP
jgi:hypothetical protein